MAISTANGPSRPELIAWEVADDSIGTRTVEQDAAASIIEAISRFGPGQQVVLTGTDSLTWNQLQSIISQGAEAGLELAIAPTDPRIFDRTTLRAITAAGLAAIVITLDGPDRATHDAIHGGQGRFDASISLARWATELGLPIWIRTNVDQLTESGIEHLASRVLALGADRWSLTFAVPGGEGLAVPELVPNQAELILSWLADLDANSDLTVFTTQAPMYQRIAAQARLEGQVGRSLVAGDNLLYVDSDGVIAPAGSMPIELGRIPEDDPVAVFHTDPLLRRLRDPTHRAGKCGSCEYKQLCGGSRARAYAHFGDPIEQDPLCPYVPTVIQESHEPNESDQ